jgi:hypothetical protein
MRPPLAEDEDLRRHANLLRVLGEQHGLTGLALGDRQGELIADLERGKTGFDVARFELEVMDMIGRDVQVTVTGAPAAHVRAPLNGTAAA